MSPLFIYFIGIAFLISLTVYFLPKEAELYLKLFPPFLFATASIELLGLYFSSINKPNVYLYNFFTIVEFNFYFFVISQVIANKRMKKIITGTIFGYTLSALVNIFFFQGMKMFHTMTYSLGCLLVVIFCIYYFLELFRLPKSVRLQKNPAFWICSGLLFFYCCGFPLYGFINYLASISGLLMNNFYTIITILNIFLYSLFTIGFLCRIEIRKYSSSQ